MHNRWTPPGIFTASMGISICKLPNASHQIFLLTMTYKGGDRFDVRADQEALLDVLEKTEKDHARRTTAVQNQMKEAWGWMSEE